MTFKEQAQKQINKLRLLVNDSEIITDEITVREYNYEFNALSGNNRVKVQVFFGKKGLKVLLQGDSTKEFYRTVNKIIFDQQSLELIQPNIDEPEEYIGTDECGKGDFFGPLVVGAVYVDNETRKKLITLGVKDSKELSDNQIGILSTKIKKMLSNNYELIKVTPQKYNLLYNQFKNLNKLLNWAHSKAIEKLIDRTKCQFVITDKFSKEKLHIDASSNYMNVQFVQLEKAEKFIGVAAASILARDLFNNWFESHSKNGLNLPKGASGNVENFARDLFKKIDDEKIAEVAKLHFKTLKKINNK